MFDDDDGGHQGPLDLSDCLLIKLLNKAWFVIKVVFFTSLMVGFMFSKQCRGLFL